MSNAYTAPFGPIQIRYDDASIIVAVKPAGLLSVPGRGPEKADCLSARLNALTVHRLDMETSGLVVFTRTPEAQSVLSRQFQNRTVEKRYVAVVEGQMTAEVGEVDLPLITDWLNRPRQKVCSEQGKPCLTRWEVIERSNAETRICLQPITGRSHQLRVHMDALGHPILGDSLYGTAGSKRAAPRLLLHAELLAFDHPATGERLQFQSDAPF